MKNYDTEVKTLKEKIKEGKIYNKDELIGFMNDKRNKHFKFINPQVLNIILKRLSYTFFIYRGIGDKYKQNYIFYKKKIVKFK